MPSAEERLIMYPNSIETMTNMNNVSRDELLKLSKDELIHML